MQHAQQKLECRQCVLKLLSNVRFLARQGLPLRGDGNECDSNYLQLLNDSRVFDWLKQKTDKYTSPEMQNEMIRVMALQVLRVIASSLHSIAFYTVMADEMCGCVVSIRNTNDCSLFISAGQYGGGCLTTTEWPYHFYFPSYGPALSILCTLDCTIVS